MFDENTFLKKYPISIHDSVFFPLIYKSWFHLIDSTLPDPNITHMIEFSRYAGFSEGAVRTACSRLKKKGSIISFKNEGKISYRMGEDRQRAANYFMGNDNKNEFTIVIFTFERENSAERYQLRKILKHSGFKMIAQNAYICLRIRKEELIRTIKENGFENNIYMFDTNENLEPFVAKNILKRWNIDGYIAGLNEFYDEIMQLFPVNEENGEKVFNRLGYVGVVNFTYFQRNEPPLVEKFLPEGTLIKKINLALLELNKKYAAFTRSHYLSLV